MSSIRAYGLLVEFGSAEQLIDAVSRARREGRYRAIEAYAPFAVEGLDEALGCQRDGIARWTLLGAVIGGVGTYALEWYSAVFDYPINAGGRPTGSWPAFLPPALEMTLLGAALFAVLAMLIGNGLPRLHHPLFGVKAFERATTDRFFMLLRAADPQFDAQSTREFCESLAPLSITEVPE